MRRALSCTVLLLFSAAGGLAGEQCNAKNGSKCSKSDKSGAEKYSKEANIGINALYLQKIEDARLSYEECDSSKCACHASMISNDLKPFKNGITKQMMQNIKSKGTTYKIMDGKLYREKDCMFPARCTGIEHFLRLLAPKLPNLEMVVNTRDWPQINKNHGPFGPVFSFSKTAEFRDIMYPAWAFWEGGPAIGLYPRGIGRWDIHREQLSKKANSTAWEFKKSRGFFRGSRTSSERDALVLLSRERPELVDAKYTKNQAWKSDADTLHAPPAEEVSFETHCDYKYLFNFRGVAASFRLKHVLLCKSLVFHVGDAWLEFFYPALKPWVHYVPVASDASKVEIARLLTFFKNNDELAQTIANNGFQMIWNNLRMQDVTCYWKKLLKRYSKLLKYTIELDGDLVEIH